MGFRITSVQANPSPSIAGSIDIQMNIRNTGSDRFLVFDSRADVIMRGVPKRGDVVLGTAFQSWPNQAQEYARNGGEGNLIVRFPLDTALLTQIEELRASRELALSLGLTVIASRLDNADKGAVLRERIDHPFSIAKSDWVEKFLPVFGLAGIELWELRFPQLVASTALAKEKEFLDQAVHDYNRGEYEDAFKDCRNVVQTLRKRRDELSLADIVGKEEWGRADHYLSLALHEDAPLHKVVRADAEFAITLVWALFRRVAHALDNPKTTPEPPLVRLKD